MLALLESPDLKAVLALQLAAAFLTGAVLARRLRPGHAALAAWGLSLLVITALAPLRYDFGFFWKYYMTWPLRSDWARLGRRDAVDAVIAYIPAAFLAVTGAYVMAGIRSARTAPSKAEPSPPAR